MEVLEQDEAITPEMEDGVTLTTKEGSDYISFTDPKTGIVHYFNTTATCVKDLYTYITNMMTVLGQTGHVADFTIHVTSEEKTAWNGAVDSVNTVSYNFTEHSTNSSIHTSVEEKSNWNTGAATAASNQESVTALESAFAEMNSKIENIMDGIYSEITSNPWSCSLADTNGITINGGYWSSSRGRVEW